MALSNVKKSAQPRVERNGCAIGNAAKIFKFGVLPRMMGAENARYVNLSLGSY